MLFVTIEAGEGKRINILDLQTGQVNPLADIDYNFPSIDFKGSIVYRVDSQLRMIDPASGR